MSTDDPEKFYVLYCCNVCHQQCDTKESLMEHRKLCQTENPGVGKDEKESSSTDRIDTAGMSPSRSSDVESTAFPEKIIIPRRSDRDPKEDCEEEIGLKITNVCSMAAPPVDDDIDGFEMECEEIEEERQSDVEESDGEPFVEPCANQIIIPQAPAVTAAPTSKPNPNSSGGKTFIYVSPPSTANSQVTASTPMNTLISSTGVATLIPQTVVSPAPVPVSKDSKMTVRKLANVPVVLRQPKPAAHTSPVTTAPAVAQTQGIRLVQVNNQGNDRKIIYIPAPANFNPASAINLGACTIGQPTSVVPQNATIKVQPASTVAAPPQSANLISLIASKVQSSGTTTVPVNTSPKFVQLLPPSSIRPQGAPLQTVMAQSTTGQSILSTVPVQQTQGSPLPVQIVSGPTQLSSATVQQPVQKVVNGQIQLAFPVQAPGNTAGVKSVQQIVLLANPNAPNALSTVKLNQLPVAVPQGGKVQVLSPLNVSQQQQQQRTVVVSRNKGLAQPSTSSVNTMTYTNKYIPVIFAPAGKPGVTVTAAPAATVTAQSANSHNKARGVVRQSPLALSDQVIKRANKKPPSVIAGINKSTNQMIYVTTNEKKKMYTINSFTQTATTTPKAVSKRKESSQTQTEPMPKIKVMINRETNTVSNIGDAEAQVNETVLFGRRRKLKSLKRKLKPVKKEEDEEFQHKLVLRELVSPNVRRSSRIKEKPAKSYVEKSDEEEDEESEEEPFLTQMDLDAETGTGTQTDFEPGGEIVKSEEEESADVTEENLDEEANAEEETKEDATGKKQDEDDPDFSPDISESEYEAEDDGDDDDYEEKEDSAKGKKATPKKRKKVPRKPPFPKVNLEDHPEKFSTEDKVMGDGIQRKIYNCTVCNVGFNCITEEAMALHISKHLSKKFACPFCSYDDVTGNLTEHISSEHPENSSCQCATCGKGFLKTTQLQKHMAKVHGEYSFTCEDCGKGFLDNRHLRKHRFKKHGASDGIWVCSNCSKVFSNKYYYDRHVNEVDCDRKPCLCQECGTLLASKTMLNVHLKRVHRKERHFMCHLCSFTSYRMNQLKDHLYTHTGDFPHKCPLCDFRSAKSYQVTSHMRTHTGKTPFKCNQCNYMSRWNIQLRTHRAAHRSPYMVMCEPCGIAYKDERGLGLHQKKRHSKTSKAGGDNGKESGNEGEEDDGADGLENAESDAEASKSRSVSPMDSRDDGDNSNSSVDRASNSAADELAEVNNEDENTNSSKQSDSNATEVGEGAEDGMDGDETAEDDRSVTSKDDLVTKSLPEDMDTSEGTDVSNSNSMNSADFPGDQKSQSTLETSSKPNTQTDQDQDVDMCLTNDPPALSPSML